MKPIRIGTRGSKLALWQANEVSRLLREAGHENEIVRIKTTGDRRTDVSLATIGGKGLFIKEIEEALSESRIDIAVHSLKDVPSIIPERFDLVAFLPRADARDAWIQPDNRNLHDLPPGARIGTGSPRRRTQLRRLRPDIEVLDVRGNVDTRIEKVRSGEFEGILLAAAGLERLGLTNVITSLFGFEEITPAAGQGIVGIEILRKRDDLRDVLTVIGDPSAKIAAEIERGVLGRFGTLLDCYTPIAVHAQLHGTTISCHAFVSSLDGSEAIRVFESGDQKQRTTLIDRVYQALNDQGALALIESAQNQ